jgi:ribose 5-phosphate isomerase B
MRVAISCDHAGFNLKNELTDYLFSLNYEVSDLGSEIFDPYDDYPDAALAVASSVAKGDADRGVIVCGSGVGASIAANKVIGIRASICHDLYSASQGVEHDGVNILCLGERVISIDLAKEILKTFLSSEFSGEDRHRRRLDKVLSIEREYLLNESSHE